MPPNTNAPTDSLRQIIEGLGTANNVLVTVSSDPSVDQLAACIGLTLALNKQGKHATAVFSGKVPSTLEFLQPERTIETNTNSLRDFIISLDKSKADKLRYKVEDEFVKIFITPYRTSISDKDLSFTQGDFNVDMIITLGVHERSHLDAAIVAHGRILHDATVASLTTDTISEIGAINWVDTGSSSLCEMASDLVMELDNKLLDAQIATALLTGMVAETNRFGNEKASPHTMSVSGVLMAAGASTQLISNKLEEPAPAVDEPPQEIPQVTDEGESSEEPEVQEEAPKQEDGTIQIEHEDDDIHIDEHGKLQAIAEMEAAQALEEPELPAEEDPPTESKMILEPPQLGGQLTANSIPEHQQLSPSTDPLSGDSNDASIIERPSQFTPPPLPEQPESFITPGPDQTLTDIERAVASPHLDENFDPPAPNLDEAVPPPPPVDDARAAVEEAVESSDDQPLAPIDALGASPVDLNLGHNPTDTLPVEENNDSDSQDKPPTVPPPLMPGV